MSSQKLVYEYSQQHYSLFAKSIKWAKCPSSDEYTDTMWYIPTMEYYWAIEINELLKHSTINEPQTHHIKQKKPDARGHILHESTYIKCPQEANPQKQKLYIACYLGTGSENED